MARLFDGVDDYLRATGITNVSGRYVTLGYWVRIPAGHSNDSFESVASVWNATNGGLGSSFLFAGTEIRGNVLSWMGSTYPTMIAQSAYSTATDYLYLIESDAQAPGDAALFRNGAIIGSRLASESRTTGTTASQLTLAASSDTTPTDFANVVVGEVFVFTGRFLTSGERADLAAGRNPAAVLDLSANGRYWPLRGTDLTEFYGREALSGVGTTEATHFTVDDPPGAGPQPPATPTITNSYIHEFTGDLVIVASGFSDPDDDGHAATQWQVRNTLDADWTTPIYDVTVDSGPLTSIDIPEATHTAWPAGTYEARVRYQDDSTGA
jgi:hypothetical protein